MSDPVPGAPQTNQAWLRLAQPGDADAIARVVNQAFQVERFFIDGERTNPQAIRELMGKGKFLVAEQDGTLVGCVYLEPRGKRYYLGLLSVDPGRQRSGIGALLLRGAEEDCRAAGAHGMDLRIVSLRTELPGYYRHFGYEVSGTAPFVGDADPKLPCYFIRMSKEFVETGEP